MLAYPLCLCSFAQPPPANATDGSAQASIAAPAGTCVAVESGNPFTFDVRLCAPGTSCDDHSGGCAAGSFAHSSGTGCTQCDRGGFFAAMTGRIGTHSHCDTACDRCNNGTFSSFAGATEAIDCHVCPPGTRTDLHAGYRACACAAGHYRLDRFGPCQPCTDFGEGVVCVDEAINLQPGYWWQFSTVADSEAYQRYTDDLKLGFDYNHNLTNFDATLLPSRAHVCKRPASCFGEIRSDCDEGYTGGKIPFQTSFPLSLTHYHSLSLSLSLSHSLNLSISHSPTH